MISRRLDACARISAEHDEPSHNLAPEGPQGYVLVEESAPWGPTGASRSERLPAELRRRCDRLGLRPILIRRAGRYESTRRACFPAYADYRGGWIERARIEDPSELLAVDLDALAAGRRPGFGVPHHEPLVLVCTHGKVDACCAELGRPVARALHEAFGERAWQCSHLGSCRFAANALVLPRAILLGRLGPGSAGDVVARALDGQLTLEHYRGRAGAGAAVQFAEAHLRARTGRLAVDDVQVVSHQAGGDGSEETVLRAGATEWRLTLREEAHGPARPGGCGDPDHWTPDHYRVLSCDPAPAIHPGAPCR